MDTVELVRTLNQLKDAREASNWAGKFDRNVREQTREHRQSKIAKPLDEAIAALESELRRRDAARKRKARRAPSHMPYKDD